MKSKKLRYLVTGAAGFIGSAVAKKLLEEGHDVVTIDNLSTGLIESIPRSVTFVEGDCQDKRVIENLKDLRFDGILHIAGQSSGEVSFDDPVYDLQTNAQSTVMLLDFAKKTGCRHFVYASSMSVYGEQGDKAIDENAPTFPKSFYAVGKLASERYMKIYADEGISSTALRLFNVYGPGQNMENMRQGMASIYLAQALKDRKIIVKGSPDRFRDFVYIDDVVEAFIACLKTDVQGYHIYNVGTGVKTTVSELIAKMSHVLPYEVEVSYSGTTPGDLHGTYADVSKIARELGWKPRIELDDGLSRMVDWASTLSKIGCPSPKLQSRRKIEPRRHLLNVNRWAEQEPSRFFKQRLDRNERNEPFSEGFVDKIRSKFSGELMMTYPEMGPVYDKVAKLACVGRDKLMLHSGSDQAIKAVFETYVSPGEKVLLHEPGYSMYDVYCKMFDANIVRIRCDEKLNFDWENFAKNIVKGLRMVVIENPNGYTGTAPSAEMLEAMIKKAEDLGVVALVDEAYYYFHDDSTGKWIDKYENLIITRTFSKALGLAGLRAGYILSQPGNIEHIRRVRPVYEINGFAAMVISEMVDNAGEFMSYVESTKKNRISMLQSFKKLGVETTDSRANFVVARLGDKSVHDNLRNALVTKDILIRRPFHQKWLQEWVRINTASPETQKIIFDELSRVIHEKR